MNTKHPIALFLANVAHGYTPHESDITGLKIRGRDADDIRANIRASVKMIRHRLDEGRRGEARQIAQQTASEIVPRQVQLAGRAGGGQPDINDTGAGSDPAELAALTPRLR